MIKKVLDFMEYKKYTHLLTVIKILSVLFIIAFFNYKMDNLLYSSNYNRLIHLLYSLSMFFIASWIIISDKNLQQILDTINKKLL